MNAYFVITPLCFGAIICLPIPILALPTYIDDIVVTSIHGVGSMHHQDCFCSTYMPTNSTALSLS